MSNGIFKYLLGTADEDHTKKYWTLFLGGTVSIL